MKLLDKLLIKIYLKLYDFLYHQISRVSVRINNGIHPKHELMKYYKFFLSNIEKNSVILDIGCGIGYVAYKIAQKAKFVIAIDIDNKSIDKAKSMHNKSNIKYINADIMNYEFDEKFDYIILSNVLEHINEREKFLMKIKDLGNIILIRVPVINRSWLSLFKKSLGIDYRLDKTHYIEYTLEKFKEELDLVQLEIVSHELQFGEIWAKVRKKFA